MKPVLLPLLLLLIACNFPAAYPENMAGTRQAGLTPATYPKGSWQSFLQHLPVKPGKVLDYQGKPIDDQAKAALIVNYDVGTRDLQQCADALIRLRAEYLFSANRFTEIQFHFTSGQLYGFTNYCDGLRTIGEGNRVKFIPSSYPCAPTHEALRRYLDIVYNYAGTISLARELHPTNQLKAGTVVIHPGSPGHCMIVTDEATTDDGTKLFKLTEGFSPAQSIYLLRNPSDPALGPWQPMPNSGPIATASCIFYSYVLGTFE